MKWKNEITRARGSPCETMSSFVSSFSPLLLLFFFFLSSPFPPFFLWREGVGIIFSSSPSKVCVPVFHMLLFPFKLGVKGLCAWPVSNREKTSGRGNMRQNRHLSSDALHRHDRSSLDAWWLLHLLPRFFRDSSEILWRRCVVCGRREGGREAESIDSDQNFWIVPEMEKMGMLAPGG